MKIHANPSSASSAFSAAATSTERSPARFSARLSALGAAARALLGGVFAFNSRRRAGIAMASGGRNDGPPDLDELWRDFNRKLGGLFGGKARGRPGSGGPNGSGGSGGGGDGPNFQPDMRSAGVGASLIAGVVALIWLGSGFFIVQEGQEAVITSFGKFDRKVGAGFQWRMPYPFEAHETVSVTQLRSREIGRNAQVPATGLRDSSMLTEDENIIDIRFTVQYRLKSARDFLFENREPEEAVTQAAESAVREIVGKSKIDSVLYEQRDAIAAELVKSIQTQLDRLKAGIIVANVSWQSVQSPEQVQNAFEDTLKAGQDGDRAKKEGLAYASDVIPKAQGTAARLREEAEGYKGSVMAQAEGDAQRFAQVLSEYQKAPAVTRQRLYIDTMQQVYSNVSKVMIDSRNNSNLLYLPLDKLMQQVGATAATTPAPNAPAPAPAPAAAGDAGSAAPGTLDSRSREGQRSRDRDSR